MLQLYYVVQTEGLMSTFVFFLPAVISGHRAVSRRHHHRLLLLLSGSEELQDHGILQEHGSSGNTHTHTLNESASG